MYRTGGSTFDDPQMAACDGRGGSARLRGMEGADWLRTQLTSFSCASCGRAYRASQISVLAQREDLFFVRLGCSRCGSQSVAIVTIQVDESESAQLEAGEITIVADDGELPDGPPVSGDDVLAMHDFLDGFDGDFYGLFTGFGDSSGTAGSR